MSSKEGNTDTRSAEQVKADKDNHADQCNPNNPKWQGHTPGYSGTGTKADLDNHSNQLNPNNPRFQAPKKT